MADPGRQDASARAGRNYLAASAAGALLTANALRPFGIVGYPTVATYLAGIVPSEFPRSTAAVATLSACLAGGRGAFRTRTGQVGLALTAASVGTLVALDRSARLDHEVLDTALAAGLGADYRTRVASVPVPPRAGLSGVTPPFPTTGRRSPFLASRDIAYGPGGARNRLDVWRHPHLPPGSRAPTVVHIHGGGWVMGSKEIQGVPLLTHLAARGFVGVAINYRLSPKHTWPDALVDVKRALGWVKANIGDHGGDPNFVAVTGGSAGGHLTALAALTAARPEFQPGFEDVDTRVQAAVPLYGAYDITDLEGTGQPHAIDFWERHIMKSAYDGERGAWATASPMLAVNADAPPTFVIHGREDALLRVEGARLFVERLKAAGAPTVCYAELPHARHGFDVFGTVRTRATVAAIERFLLVALAESGGSR